MSDIFQVKPSQLEKTERELKKMENEIYAESHALVYSTVAHTFDLDPAQPADTIPAAWEAELARGEVTVEELAKRKRIAQAAWQSPKNAPVALQIAAKVLSGMHKAKAMEGAAPRHLNVTMVSISTPGQPVPQFPEKEIKHE
jgi:hypothetical protein